MQIHKIFFFVFFFCLAGSSLFAQYTKEDAENNEQNKPGHSKPPVEKSFSDRLFSGGGLGLSFGTITQINVSPMIGYEITEKWAAGLGGTYIYYRDNRYDASTNILGGRLFSQYYITESILLHSEYELISFEDYLNEGRINVKSLLGGAGYRSRVGGNSFIYILALYNFGNPFGTNPPGYFISNPVLRMGFSFGL